MKSMGGLELLKEADIVLGEHAEVLDLVFQVCDTFHTHTEGKTAVDFGVNAACLKYVGVNHTATKYFNPSCMLAE